MSPKLIGCCTCCDREVFDVARRDADRRPIETGAAHEDAMRVKFVLVDGKTMDLTFCEPCASSLTSAQFPHIWQRVMVSWIAESGADHPTVKGNASNGILGIFAMKHWKEVLSA